MEFCVVDDSGSYGDEAYYHCLADPAPREYFGTETHWPSAVDVEFAKAPRSRGADYFSDESRRGLFLR